MKPLTGADITGTWATVLLPLDGTGAIDFARLEDEIDYLTMSGVDGIYSNGTAGEFYAQEEYEFDRLHGLLSEKCERATIPYQIGVNHTSAHVSLARLKRARALRPGAFQVILPDWWPPTDEEAIDFLQHMAEAADPVPLVLYNPPHAKRLLSLDAIGTLAAAIPQLVGIKVASGDDEWYRAMRGHAGRLSVFVEGHRIASGLRNGASGSYSNVACLQPVGAAWWNALALRDMNAALEFEARLLGFFGAHVLPLRETCGYSNAALDKLLAAVGGWANIGTRLRWPYRFTDHAAVDRLRPIARRLLPELFAGKSTEPQ
jgi:dihydrodipicolinate synthase/N-acetylneuraminate lyase